MTNSEEGKKILDTLSVVRDAHYRFSKLPCATQLGAKHLIEMTDFLCAEHSKLCCNKCGQYNDECTCK